MDIYRGNSWGMSWKHEPCDFKSGLPRSFADGNDCRFLFAPAPCFEHAKIICSHIFQVLIANANLTIICTSVTDKDCIAIGRG